jgi:hypothetical protein
MAAHLTSTQHGRESQRWLLSQIEEVGDVPCRTDVVVYNTSPRSPTSPLSPVVPRLKSSSSSTTISRSAPSCVLLVYRSSTRRRILQIARIHGANSSAPRVLCGPFLSPTLVNAEASQNRRAPGQQELPRAIGARAGRGRRRLGHGHDPRRVPRARACGRAPGRAGRVPLVRGGRGRSPRIARGRARVPRGRRAGCGDDAGWCSVVVWVDVGGLNKSAVRHDCLGEEWRVHLQYNRLRVD